MNLSDFIEDDILIYDDILDFDILRCGLKDLKDYDEKIIQIFNKATKNSENFTVRPFLKRKY